MQHSPWYRSGRDPRVEVEYVFARYQVGMQPVIGVCRLAPGPREVARWREEARCSVQQALCSFQGKGRHLQRGWDHGGRDMRESPIPKTNSRGAYRGRGRVPPNVREKRQNIWDKERRALWVRVWFINTSTGGEREANPRTLHASWGLHEDEAISDVRRLPIRSSGPGGPAKAGSSLFSGLFTCDSDIWAVKGRKGQSVAWRRRPTTGRIN